MRSCLNFSGCVGMRVPKWVSGSNCAVAAVETTALRPQRHTQVARQPGYANHELASPHKPSQASMGQAIGGDKRPLKRILNRPVWVVSGRVRLARSLANERPSQPQGR